MENGAEKHIQKHTGSAGWWGEDAQESSPPSLAGAELEECAAPCSSALETGVPLSHPGAQQEQLSFTVSSFLTRLSLFAFPAVCVRVCTHPCGSVRT